MIQILEKIGCVELYGIKKTGKAGPFAARTTIEIGRLQSIESSFRSIVSVVRKLTKRIVNQIIILSFLCEVPIGRFAHDQDIYVDPKPEAILRLGEFIGEKKYEKDYVPKCSCHSKTDS